MSNLITYLGFKELLFVGGSSDNVFAIDAALNRPFWELAFHARRKCAGIQPHCNMSRRPDCTYRYHRREAARWDLISGAARRAPGAPGVGPGQGGAAKKPAKAPDRPVASGGGIFSSGFGRNGYVSPWVATVFCASCANRTAKPTPFPR